MKLKGSKKQIRASANSPVAASFACDCGAYNWFAAPDIKSLLIDPEVTCWKCHRVAIVSGNAPQEEGETDMQPKTAILRSDQRVLKAIMRTLSQTQTDPGTSFACLTHLIIEYLHHLDDELKTKLGNSNDPNPYAEFIADQIRNFREFPPAAEMSFQFDFILDDEEGATIVGTASAFPAV